MKLKALHKLLTWFSSVEIKDTTTNYLLGLVVMQLKTLPQTTYLV